MYFLGMIVFDLCLFVDYDFLIIGFFVVFGIVVVWVVFYFLIKFCISFVEIILGGVLVGVGIGIMYYSGMVVMEMVLFFCYDFGMFVFFIVVVVCLVMLLLWIKFGIIVVMKSKKLLGKYVLFVSIVMGLVIFGMYYMGMVVVRFVLLLGMEMLG